MTNAPRAVFENVARRFSERPVFEGLNFELKRGRRYALLGPNGAGKSTLIALLAGRLRPDEGRVLIEGLNPWRHRLKVMENLGLVEENAPLMAELTVQEHLKLAADLRGLSRGEFKAEGERLVQALNLSDFLHCPAGTLSLGQRRRAALAAAFMGGPEILALDEPSSGLDPEEGGRLRRLVADLPPTATVIISSHILSEVYDLTDEIIVLAHGRLMAQGPWGDFSAPPVGPGENVLREIYLKLTEAP